MHKQKREQKIMMLRFIILITALFFPQLLIAKETVTSENSASTIETLPLDELAALADVYAEIKKFYVKELSDKEILDGAIRGMLDNLDAYSSYLTAEEFTALEESATGDYAGIGIEAEHLAEGIKVISLIKDSPAKKSKLKKDDLIIAINGISTVNMSEEDGSKLIRGKPGTELNITVISAGDGAIKNIRLIREIIHLTSIRYELLEPNIGFVHINEFQIRTATDLSQAISSMELANKGPLAAFILDLRQNPGGLLDGAIEVSDLFLNQGTIVSTKSRIEANNEIHTATSGDILRGKPMVVLIDHNSASASEIVAGALQDNKRATIMGTKSFGKAMVQTLLPIHGGSAIKLTTALYYTPNERSIQDLGIVPDVNIEFEQHSASSIEQQSSENKPSYHQDNQVLAAVEYLKQQIKEVGL